MKCPGQDTQYWKENSIFETKCPECGSIVEFFKDDPARKCANCGKKFVNPKMDFGCAAYCQFAEQCIGTLPEEFKEQRDNMLKDKIAVAVKKYFSADFKRIGHAANVAYHAEKIGREKNADMAVVMAAAYLHDIGIHEAEKKYGDSYMKYHEKEGVPVAMDILTKLFAPEDLIEKVCDIVGRHHRPPDKNDSLEFRVVLEADRIVNAGS